MSTEITDRIDRMLESCRSRSFLPQRITMGAREAGALVDWLDETLGASPAAEHLNMTPAQRLHGARYRDCLIEVLEAETFLRVEAIWWDQTCEPEWIHRLPD